MPFRNNPSILEKWSVDGSTTISPAKQQPADTENISALDQSSNSERPSLWKRGAETASEDVATPTITTIEPQQGDETSSRAKSQSNVSSDNKVSEKNSDEQGNDEKSLHWN